MISERYSSQKMIEVVLYKEVRMHRSWRASLFYFLFVLIQSLMVQQSLASTCSSVFQYQTKALTEVEQQAEVLFARAVTGVSARGFLGSEPKLSPASKEAAYSRGLMYWGIRIYVVKTLEEAIDHAQGERDPLMQGVYLIGEEIPQNHEGVSASYFFRKLINNGMYYIQEGKVDRISWQHIHDRFLPDIMEWAISEPERGFYIYQKGWFFPKYRGMIRYEDTLKSETYKKLRKLARSLINKGFQITFNTAYREALEKIAQQERRGQVSGSSRYMDDLFVQESVQSFLQHKAFSVEVWDPEGRLVGGNVGVISGNLFSPDSVFYDTQSYKNGIDFAKISVVALMDRLQNAGIGFLDAGMVTPFTASLKGRYVTAEEFLKTLKTLPQDKKHPDFASHWRP